MMFALVMLLVAMNRYIYITLFVPCIFFPFVSQQLRQKSGGRSKLSTTRVGAFGLPTCWGTREDDTWKGLKGRKEREVLSINFWGDVTDTI